MPTDLLAGMQRACKPYVRGPTMPEPGTPVEMIAQALAAHPWNSYPHAAHKEHNYDSACGVCRGDVEALANVAVHALTDAQALAGAGLVVVPAQLLDDLTDADPCWFDHHGGCQAHGFLSLEPGERCPHAEAQEMLAALPERNETP